MYSDSTAPVQATRSRPGRVLTDAQILVMREDLNWIGDPDRVAAIMLLDLVDDEDGHYLALRLARVLHAHSAAALADGLSPLLLLAISVAILNARIVSPALDPDDAELLAREAHRAGSQLRGVYPTEAAAAAAGRSLAEPTRTQIAFQAGFLLLGNPVP